MLPWIQQLKKRKKTVIGLTLFLAVFFAFFSAVVSVHAQQTDTFGVQAVGQNLPLGGEDIRIIIGRIIRAVLGLLFVVALCLVLYAGFTIMTAGGDEAKVAEGKKILTNAAIGLAIILSSLAIVQFILNKLGEATGSGSITTTGTPPGIENFSGSGALGDMVKDHYPFRDQKNVSRNTKIAVTFGEPIDPSTIIVNTNGSCWGKDDPSKCTTDDKPKYGDCVAPPVGQEPNMDRDCDHLNVDPANHGVGITLASSTNNLIPAVALTTYNADQEAVSYLFWTIQPLGDAVQTLRYTVTLTEKINTQSGRAAFSAHPYTWNFETGTTLDLDPPTVARVIPNSGSLAPKNSIVQINFSEAMDPTTVQGILDGVGGTSNFTNIIFNKRNVTGEWRVSNGYRTVEFISDQPCGTQNSCGEELYCLPVVCVNGESGACKEDYSTLIRTAALSGVGGFQSFPFSGVSDMAGNALDGNTHKGPNGKPVPDGKPSIDGDGKSITDKDTRPNNNDNYFWNYSISGAIQRDTPIIESITPEVDAENVDSSAPIQVIFNQAMMGTSLSTIAIEEYRAGGNGSVDKFWYRPVFENSNGKTVVTFDHRVLGPNNTDYYYLTKVPSTVKNTYQNCFYPGRGPKEGASCDVSRGTCTPVMVESESDTGCANRGNVPLTTADIVTCVNNLKSVSND